VGPVGSGRVWILPEPNEELDARKLSRAFLALALHQAAEEAAAQQDYEDTRGHGGSHERA
jgi:hypothetical protein